MKPLDYLVGVALALAIAACIHWLSKWTVYRDDWRCDAECVEAGATSGRYSDADRRCECSVAEPMPKCSEGADRVGRCTP